MFIVFCIVLVFGLAWLGKLIDDKIDKLVPKIPEIIGDTPLSCVELIEKINGSGETNLRSEFIAMAVQRATAKGLLEKKCVMDRIDGKAGYSYYWTRAQPD